MKWFLGTAFLVMLVIGGMYSNYIQKRDSGYCFAEERFFSETELVETAIAVIYSELSSQYNEMPSAIQRLAKKYNSPKSIRIENSDCCDERLVPFAGANKQQSELLLGKYGFFYSGRIFLQLDEVETDNSNASLFRPRIDYTITSCGRLREWRVYNSKYYTKSGVSGGS